jgi:serum/glucocorticoid-regulated kinase 2
MEAKSTERLQRNWDYLKK